MQETTVKQNETAARQTLEARGTIRPESFSLFNVILSAYMDGLQTGAQMNSAAETKKGA